MRRRGGRKPRLRMWPFPTDASFGRLRLHAVPIGPEGLLGYHLPFHEALDHRHLAADLFPGVTGTLNRAPPRRT